MLNGVSLQGSCIHEEQWNCIPKWTGHSTHRPGRTPSCTTTEENTHRDKLDVLLQELEDAEVIENVEGPTDWVSNIVITPKADPTKISLGFLCLLCQSRCQSPHCQL